MSPPRSSRYHVAVGVLIPGGEVFTDKRRGHGSSQAYCSDPIQKGQHVLATGYEYVPLVASPSLWRAAHSGVDSESQEERLHVAGERTTTGCVVDRGLPSRFRSRMNAPVRCPQVPQKCADCSCRL